MKLALVPLLVLLTLASLLHAQTPDTMEIHRDLIYATPDGIPLKLDLYVPKNSGAPLPVILWIHGGGWQMGSKEIPMVLPMAHLGFALVSVNYRLSQQAIFPAQIFDVKAAVRWVRANAGKYGLNGNKIGAAGASAGGHLAALLGTTANQREFEGNEGTTGVSSAVQAVVDYFGPTDLLSIGREATAEQNANIQNPVVRLLGGPVVKKTNLARLASPALQVTSQACPFFIVHGDQDSIVPLSQSTELNDALKKAGVPSQLVVVQGGGHGFSDPASFAQALQFLQQHLQTP